MGALLSYHQPNVGFRSATSEAKEASVSGLRLACGPRQVPTLTQIGNAVIGAVAVDVIYLVGRPDAVRIEPRKAMGSILPPIDANTHIAGTMDATGHVASTGWWRVLVPTLR